MSNNIKIPKKLIEVALPLDDINAAAAREKSIRHGHPSTLHLWWARRPLAAVRAVLFAQLVNDPGGMRGWGKYPKQTKEDAQRERERLFDIIRELVKWENSNNDKLFQIAREEIRKSWQETCEMNKGVQGFDPDELPVFHDPFAGGGAIPLEAQRFGLESYASDLNPVAVMINKAMIEIPPKFQGAEPIGPLPDGEDSYEKKIGGWSGATGLAEDVRRYGYWMRKEAEKSIGHLYPKIEITSKMTKGRPDLDKYVGRKLRIIAWLWARTVKSPNPAYSHISIPLTASFQLATKKGKEAYINTVIENGNYRFEIKKGKPDDPIAVKKGTKSGRGANFWCLMSKSPISQDYIRGEFCAKRDGSKLMAIVAEGDRERVYLNPFKEQEELCLKTSSSWRPSQKMNKESKDLVSGRGYGFGYWHELFTPRQLEMLSTFTRLIKLAHKEIECTAQISGFDKEKSREYADGVALYLSFCVSRMANYSSTICTWHSGVKYETVTSVFGRQALPMTWDFAEANVMGISSGSWINGLNWTVRAISNLNGKFPGKALQQNAMVSNSAIQNPIVSTDPPYFDNINYADLSDYFYVWMRKALSPFFPEHFSTIAVPKAEELVATPYRHGGKEQAEQFFMDGMKKTIENLHSTSNPSFPMTIFYAFKQSKTSQNKTVSTGWETFLEGVVQSGFTITGTWPIRTEYTGNLKKAVNALASSIVLVCQKRKENTDSISRRQFQRELRAKMPEALDEMIGGADGLSPIAPVDLAQASIGPGMAIFSSYDAVLNQDGSKMSVHDALIFINRAITEYLNPDSGDFDADTLFCDDWFSQNGWGEGLFGEANVLAQAKGTTVDGVADSGVAVSGEGKVRLLKWSEYPTSWDPRKDKRLPIWEACHQIIRMLNQQGEKEAGNLLAKMPERGEPIRQLAYHLYTQCERKKWAEEARSYNELIGSWHAIVSASQKIDTADRERQLELDF